MPWPISAAMYRHGPDDALAAECGDDGAAADAGHHAQVQRLAEVRRAGLRGTPEHLRLDDPDDEVGGTERRIGRRDRDDAEALGQPPALAVARLDDDERGRVVAGLHQAADDGARHVAAADECDGAGHRPSVRKGLARRQRRACLGAASCCGRGLGRPHRRGSHGRHGPERLLPLRRPCAFASTRKARCRSCIATARSAARRAAAAASASISAPRFETLVVTGEQHPRPLSRVDPQFPASAPSARRPSAGSA